MPCFARTQLSAVSSCIWCNTLVMNYARSHGRGAGGLGRRNPRKKKIFKPFPACSRCHHPKPSRVMECTQLSPPVKAAVLQGTPGSSGARRCWSGAQSWGIQQRRHNETPQFQLYFMMLHHPYCSVQCEDVCLFRVLPVTFLPLQVGAGLGGCE